MVHNKIRPFNLQRFADEPGAPAAPAAPAEGEGKPAEGEGGGEQTPAAEFRFKDPKSGRDISLPATIGDVNTKSLIEGIIAKSNTDAKNKYRKIEDLLGQKDKSIADIRAELDDVKLQQLPEKERDLFKQRQESEKMTKDLDLAMASAVQNRNFFESYLVKNEILKVMGKKMENGQEAYNPDTSMAVLLANSVARVEDVKNDDNKTVGHKVFLKTTLRDSNGNAEEVELEPGEIVPRFLNLPGNENMLKASIAPGHGTKNGSGKRQNAADGNVYKRSDLRNSETLMKEYHDRKLKGEDVSMADE